jgi:hypothetical protein
VNSFKFFPPPNKAAAMQVQVVGHELLFSIIIYLFVGCVKDSKKASDVLDVVRQQLFIFWAKIFILMNPPPKKKGHCDLYKDFLGEKWHQFVTLWGKKNLKSPDLDNRFQNFCQNKYRRIHSYF